MTISEVHTMDARLNYFASPTGGKVLESFMSVGKGLKDSPLPVRPRCG